MPAPHDLLNPAHFAKVRLPATEAETLPPWCYTSKEWFNLEVERLLRPNWNYIGHTNRVPNPGDYIAFDYLGSPIIVMRGRLRHGVQDQLVELRLLAPVLGERDQFHDLAVHVLRDLEGTGAHGVQWVILVAPLLDRRRARLGGGSAAGPAIIQHIGCHIGRQSCAAAVV